MFALKSFAVEFIGTTRTFVQPPGCPPSLKWVCRCRTFYLPSFLCRGVCLWSGRSVGLSLWFVSTCFCNGFVCIRFVRLFVLGAFIGPLHGSLVFPFCVPSGTIFGGFWGFFALTSVKAGFDTPAKLAAWCPSVCGRTQSPWHCTPPPGMGLDVVTRSHCTYPTGGLPGRPKTKKQV